MLQIRCVGATDIGKKRTTNQDQFLIARLNKSLVVDQSSIAADDQARFVSDAEGHLLLVADGMGGHAAGDVASRVAIDSAAAYVLNTIPWFYRLSHDCDEDFQDELKQALDFCHRQLMAKSEGNSDLRDMGTTLTMAYIIGRSLYIVHVGDSRCYLLQEGRLHQITRDHTLAQMMVDRGQLPPESIEDSPLSHVLWNAIGGREGSELKPDVIKCQLKVGDKILLCTDGLSRHMTNTSIQNMLERDTDLQQQCDELVAAANLGGGSDNITVVLASIEPADPESHSVLREASQNAELTNTHPLADTDEYLPLS